MFFPNLLLVSPPVRRLALGLALVLIASPLPATWPTIDDVSPRACIEGQPFTISGHHFGDNVLDLVAVIRDSGRRDGATTTITEILNASPPQSIVDTLEIELDPVGRHFTGDLELHVVARLPIPSHLMIRGPREYQLSDIQWIESVCHVPGGRFTVNPPLQTAVFSEPGVGGAPQYILMRDPSTAMNSTVILASDPPPDCATLDLSSPVDPLLTSGFFARITVSRVEGPPPTTTEWRADLAMAIQQTFAAYGIVASTHPDGVVISSTSGLGAGFAVFFPGGLEP